MAEELDSKPADNKPELTEIEQRAVSQGWVPHDEWEGNPDQWRPAKEFLDRGELFKKIDDQNRTIKQFKQVLDEFAKHHAKVSKVEYERALATLKEQKKQALSDGDVDAVVDLDEKIDLVRDAQRTQPETIKVPDAPAEVHPAFTAWRERNGWYETDKAMRAYADRVGNELGQQGLSPADILSAVEREVKKEFAHKFTNPRRDRPSSVEGTSSKGGSRSETFTLSDFERRAMQKFVRNIPGYTEAMYIEELKKVKGA